MIIEDYTQEAIQGYILNELTNKGPKTVQFFTDGCNNEDRREISEALNTLTQGKEITRSGNVFKIKGGR